MRSFWLVFVVLFLCGPIVFSQNMVDSSLKKIEWKLLAFTELGFEYIDNSYFSTISTQDNIWNQEIKEVGEFELGFQFKPQKKMKVKVEIEFDKNSPQPKFKDFWIGFNLKSKQKVKMGYFKNQMGRFFNTSKKQRLGLNKTMAHDFISTTMVMERDVGLEYQKSFKKKGSGARFRFKISADAAKNIFTNPSMSFTIGPFLTKVDYIGILSERKEYDLSLYNQLAGLSTVYESGRVLQNLASYKLVNELFVGDNFTENLRNETLGVSENEQFMIVEQKHSVGTSHDLLFLKASQYILGVSLLNPSELRNLEVVSGLNLHLNESSSLIWKSELLWRLISREGFTVASSVQFIL